MVLLSNSGLIECLKQAMNLYLPTLTCALFTAPYLTHPDPAVDPSDESCI